MGAKISLKEPIKSSNAVTRIKMAINKLVRYSILPKPKGCFFVGCLEESFAPTIVISEVAESEALFAPSEMIAIEPTAKPTMILITASRVLTIIPSAEVVMVIPSRVFGFCFKILYNSFMIVILE